MSYAFSRVMGALGKKDDDDPQQQQANIFAPQQDQATRGGPKMGGDRVQGGSIAGSVGSNDAGSTYAPTGPAPAAESSIGGQSRLMSQNAGRAKSPVKLGNIQEDIRNVYHVRDPKNDKDTGGTAQAEADAYMSGVVDPYDGDGNGGTRLTDGDRESIDSFASTDPDKGWEGPHVGNDAIKRFQSGTAGLAERADWKVDHTLDSLDDIQTDEGIKGLFRSQGDAEYGGNEATLDMALLRKNGTFNEARDATVGQGKVMQAAVDKMRKDVSGDAQHALDENYNDWRSSVANSLTGHIDGYRDAARGREKIFEDELAAGTKGALGQLRKGTYGVDQQDYYSDPTADAKKVGWQDFVTEDEHGAWERILGALGQGGDDEFAGGYGGLHGKKGGAYSGRFDRAGFDQAISDARAKAEAARDPAPAPDGPFGDAYTLPPGVKPILPSDPGSIANQVSTAIQNTVLPPNPITKPTFDPRVITKPAPIRVEPPKADWSKSGIGVAIPNVKAPDVKTAIKKSPKVVQALPEIPNVNDLIGKAFGTTPKKKTVTKAPEAVVETVSENPVQELVKKWFGGKKW